MMDFRSLPASWLGLLLSCSSQPQRKSWVSLHLEGKEAPALLLHLCGAGAREMAASSPPKLPFNKWPHLMAPERNPPLLHSLRDTEAAALGWPRGMVRGRRWGWGIRMGNTCITVVDSYWCMAKTDVDVKILKKKVFLYDFRDPATHMHTYFCPSKIFQLTST